MKTHTYSCFLGDIYYKPFKHFQQGKTQFLISLGSVFCFWGITETCTQKHVSRAQCTSGRGRVSVSGKVRCSHKPISPVKGWLTCRLYLRTSYASGSLFSEVTLYANEHSCQTTQRSIAMVEPDCPGLPSQCPSKRCNLKSVLLTFNWSPSWTTSPSSLAQGPQEPKLSC